MNDFALFTDVSLNPGLKSGVGVYLVVPVSFLEGPPYSIKRSEVAEQLIMRRFEGTSSTKLEVQTVLWALENYRNECNMSRAGKLYLYSDSSCVAGLLKRRASLEGRNFLGMRYNSSLTQCLDSPTSSLTCRCWR